MELMLKEIRGTPVWLRLRKNYPEKKRENLEEEGRKEEIKEIEEEEKKTKQDQKGKMKSEKEEGIRKTGYTVEEGEEVEEIYHDGVEEEENTEEDPEEEEKKKRWKLGRRRKE